MEYGPFDHARSKVKAGTIMEKKDGQEITPDMDYSEMCDKLMDAMTKIKIDGLTGVDGITWEKNGEPNKAPKGVKIENGAYVSMD